MSTDNACLLDDAFSGLLETEVPVERRQERLARLRNDRPEIAVKLERALINRCCAQQEAIEDLGGVVDELKRLTTKLTRAPVREGIFLGLSTLVDGRVLAHVVVGNQEALLEVADDALLDQLDAGDLVHVTAEGNAVIGKSDATTPEPGECAVVQHWLENGRLVLRHRDQEIVVRAAARLTAETVKVGDKIRLDRAGWLAMEHVAECEGSRHAATEEATSLPPEALAGYDDIRDAILRRITYAVAYPDVARSYGMREQRPWILLGGPPGVGKTTLARIVAGELHRETGQQCRIRKVNGAELLSPYVGETEHRIKALLRDTDADEGWSILFIDEVDAIARTRGGVGNVHSDRFLSSWLAELEGFQGRTRCILVAATNRLDMLDSAFRSRFSREIHMPRPRMGAARAIFARHLTPEYPYYPNGADADRTRHSMIESAVAKLYLPNAPGVTIATLRLRDGKTRPVLTRELMSGRLIEQICTDARERAFQRHIEGGNPGLCANDIDAAVDAVRDRLRGTLTPLNVHSYLTDLPSDLGVISIEPAARMRAGATFTDPVMH